MNKVVCFSFFFWAVMSLNAQPAGHFRHGDHHADRIERLAAKSDYQYRLVSFRTSDGYQFCDFFYDGSKRLVAIKDSVSNDYSLIDSLTYDSEGQIVRMSGWQLLNGVWENVYVIYYEYDEDGNRISRTNYNNFSGDWQLGGVYTYSYDDNGRVVLSELTMGGMVFQKVGYSYSPEDGNLVCELWYAYDGSGLYPSEKIVYQWDGGRNTADYDSVSDDGVSWRFNGRSEYRYDEEGNCTEYHHYDMTGGEAERSLYNINMDLPLSITYMPWTPETTRPKTFNNVHAYDREAWYSVDVEHVLHYVCDFIYEYEDVNLGIGTEGLSAVKIAPNPAHGFVSVEGVGEGPASVRIFDVMGRQVMGCEISSAVSRVDVLKLEPGCYVLRIDEKKGSFTTKLMIY